jgi:hypothetical protein
MSGSFMVATAVRAVLLAVAAWGMVDTNAADAVAAAQTRRVARIEEAISELQKSRCEYEWLFTTHVHVKLPSRQDARPQVP